MKNTKIAALTLVAATLGGTTLAAGVAGAALQDDETPPVLTEETVDVDGDTGAADDTAEEEGHRGRRGHRGNSGMAEILTDVLGVDMETLQAARQDGQSIADVAAANGVDTQVVIDTLVANANTRMQAAIDEGRITEEQVAERNIDIEAKITDRVNGVSDGERGHKGHHRGATADETAPEVVPGS